MCMCVFQRLGGVDVYLPSNARGIGELGSVYQYRSVNGGREQAVRVEDLYYFQLVVSPLSAIHRVLYYCTFRVVQSTERKCLGTYTAPGAIYSSL